jgi:hypothetical protein
MTANATIQLSAKRGPARRTLGLWTIVNSRMVPLDSPALGAFAPTLGARSAPGIGGLVRGVVDLVVAQRSAGTFAVVRQRESVAGQELRHRSGTQPGHLRQE